MLVVVFLLCCVCVRICFHGRGVIARFVLPLHFASFRVAFSCFSTVYAPRTFLGLPKGEDLVWCMDRHCSALYFYYLLSCGDSMPLHEEKKNVTKRCRREKSPFAQIAARTKSRSSLSLKEGSSFSLHSTWCIFFCVSSAEDVSSVPTSVPRTMHGHSIQLIHYCRWYLYSTTVCIRI